ncbi:MAG: GxxExxY protein [Akkermansiaceae bacterium]|nr:GxxExxY protein [Akkermansiaceae bacterium]
MPIRCPISIRPISDGEFQQIDRLVMGCAFASQNELGRLADERVYENDVANRLRAVGFVDVQTQVPVVAEWRGFSKEYRLDLVAGQMVYELKTVAAFTATHESQVFNYAALLEIDRIKLINFRPAKVQGRLKRCPFRETNRRGISVDTARFRRVSPRCAELIEAAESMLRDWGGFLDATLYREGLTFALGGPDTCERRVPVMRAGVELGTHRVDFHHDECAFIVTTLNQNRQAHETHLRRLMNLLPLKAWQWLNIDRTHLTATTLT